MKDYQSNRTTESNVAASTKAGQNVEKAGTDVLKNSELKKYTSGYDMLKDVYTNGSKGDKVSGTMNAIGNVLSGIATGDNEWLQNRQKYFDNLNRTAQEGAEEATNEVKTQAQNNQQREETVNQYNFGQDLINTFGMDNLRRIKEALGEQSISQDLMEKLISALQSGLSGVNVNNANEEVTNEEVTNEEVADEVAKTSPEPTHKSGKIGGGTDTLSKNTSWAMEQQEAKALEDWANKTEGYGKNKKSKAEMAMTGADFNNVNDIEKAIALLKSQQNGQNAATISKLIKKYQDDYDRIIKNTAPLSYR